MNILYTSDDRFAHIAGVSILSLYENNKDVEEINLYFIDNGISEQSKKRLTEIADSYKREIFFLNAPDVESIADTAIEKHIDNRCSLAVYLRLFISSLLPADMERIIFLDCDTIIRSSLLGLWNTDQGKNVLSGVVVSPVTSTSHLSIMLGKNDVFINAGILLINLKLWRAHNIEEKFVKFLQLMDGNPPWYDQGAINCVLKGYINPLDPTYNYKHKYFGCHYNAAMAKPNPIIKERVYEIADNPVIVHYTASYRPWEVKNIKNNTFCDEWLKYRHMTPWRDEPLALKEPIQIHQMSEKKKKRGIRRVIALVGRFLYVNEIKNRVYAVHQSLKAYRYIKHRQKITGIMIEDCRIIYEVEP